MEMCDKSSTGSSTLSHHLAGHLMHLHKNKIKCKPKDVRAILRVEIIWQGDPISCNKSFGKRNCSLCLAEKLAIWNATIEEERKVKEGKGKIKNKLMNSRSEILGSCAYRAKFHKFIRLYQKNTDDGTKLERVVAREVDGPTVTPNERGGDLNNLINFFGRVLRNTCKKRENPPKNI